MVQKLLKNIGLNYLSLNLRSVALARILVGFVLIFDWYYRFSNAFAFYTDAGVVPRGQAITNYTNPYYFSFLFTAGQPIYIYAFFILGLFCYLGFTFGYKTKINNILSWLFFISLSARTAVVSHAGDDLIRLFLFWLIFIPSHQFFSIDRLMTKLNSKSPETESVDDSVLSIAGLALIFQLTVMYVFTAVLKIHPIWNSEASAIYYALQLDQFLTWFGEIFRQMPYSILQLLTRITFVIELVFPLLIFIPWKNSNLRAIVIITFIGFHLGLFSVFNLGNFPWICMAYWLILTPSFFWDYLIEILKKRQTKTIVYYDPDCELCRKASFFIQHFLALKFVQIKSGNTNAGILKSIRQNNSWMIETANQNRIYNFNAFVHLVSISPFRFVTILLNTSVVRYFGQKAYLVISKNRKAYLSPLNFFKQIQNPNLSNSFIQVIVLFFITIAIYWNFATLKKDDNIVLPKPVEIVGSVFRLNQFWTMFAPFPTFDDGWVIVDAELFNGQKWDILNHRPVDYSRPESISGMYKDTMWRKYFINIRTREYEDYRLFLGRYLCRQWNNDHTGTEQVKTFKIYYLLESTQPYGQPMSQIVQEMLWSHQCF